MEEIKYNWNEDCETILDTYTECTYLQKIEVYRLLKEHYEELEQVRPLIDFIFTRIETVSPLVLNWRLWDAEIILRSALETLVKFSYILSGTKEEYRQRCEEFWSILPEIYSLKLSMQGKRNLEHLGDSEIHRLAYSPLVLSDEKENQIKEKWSKSERQKIEQSWSFSEIVLFLSRKFKGTDLEKIIVLTHTYRIASHVTHGDETGILIIHERERRPESQRKIADRAHFLRFISDFHSYSQIIARWIIRYLKLENELKNSMEIEERISSINHIVEYYQSKLYEDIYYDKFRKNTNNE